MILYEQEGKKLLQAVGVAVPKSQLLTSVEEKVAIPVPLFLKAQVLRGKRADLGGILCVDEDLVALEASLKNLFASQIGGEPVKQILVEEVVTYTQSFYISFTYDQETGLPMLSWSAAGGAGIEKRAVEKILLNPVALTVSARLPLPSETVDRLLALFFKSDCVLLEINPFVLGKAKDGIERWYALDAKIKLDDNASGRHPEWRFAPRSVMGRVSTKQELAAREIDRGSHRGTAGSAYFDLAGDIAVLASGGGASLVAMDALISYGGRPANYTEYSGNPPRDKVERLTEIVLSKPSLKGLWVVGAIANFTDIYETLSGLIGGLRRAEQALGRKFTFPIVIRRGGPRDQEAFAMLKTIKDFNLHIYGEELSITQAAKVMVQLAYGSTTAQ